MHVTTVSHRHSGKQKSYPRLFLVVVILMTDVV